MLFWKRKTATTWPLSVHGALLAVFVVGMVALWMMPVLVMGDPWEVAPNLLLARNVAESGMFTTQDELGRWVQSSLLRHIGVPSAVDGRLTAVLYAWVSPWIGWDNLVGWSGLAAGTLGLSLVPLWDAFRRITNLRTAWIAVVVYALLPVMWVRALRPDAYPFAYLFFFLAVDAFLILRSRSLLRACAVSGVLFGLSLSAKDVFLLFLPWLLVALFWCYRNQLRRALVLAAVFLMCAGIVYLLPYIGDIVRYGYPVNQNIARVWPGAVTVANASYLHLYPDPYTYLFDRERFVSEHLADVAAWPLIRRMQEQKVLLGYGLKDGMIITFLNGVWLFLNHLPGLFQMGTIGGPMLWLFIIPGMIMLWQEQRNLVGMFVGLMAALYLELSFILHYEREHVMDIAWILILFAAVGIHMMSETIAAQWKRFSAGMISVFITGALSLHLLHVNRVEFARLYERTNVPTLRANAMKIRTLPMHAVVLVPFHPSTLEATRFLADRTLVLLRESTVQRLLHEGRFNHVASAYGVTHALGFAPAVSDAMHESLGSLILVDLPVTEPSELPDWLEYVLHVLR